MALKRCDAGLHYYDPEKSDSCPYCRVQEGEGDAGGDTISADTISDTETFGGEDTTIAQPAASQEFEENEDDSDETVSFGIGSAPVRGTLEDGQYVSIKGKLDPEGHTVGIFKKKTQFAPVVGWLICADGAERGKDYRIHPGINLVGRHNNSHIVIKGDDTISREDHAEIEYDPEENAFYLIRKKNPETRLNGKKVRQPQLLTSHDVVQFGETALLFVPLCSEKFQWSVEQ